MAGKPLAYFGGNVFYKIVELNRFYRIKAEYPTKSLIKLESLQGMQLK